MSINITSEQVTAIAQMCHEVNRVYCESIGDTSQNIWDLSPGWQQTSAIRGVIFHLNQYVKGVPVPPSASHDSWLREKAAEGWKYGPVKNPDAKEHPCFVPYNQLPVAQKLKDYLFGAVCTAFFNAHSA